MNQLLAVLAAPVSAEQTQIPFVGQAAIVLPMKAMFVDVKASAEGAYEVVDITDASNGNLTLTRTAPVSWDAGIAFAIYDPQIETAQAKRVLGNIRREVFQNARI